MNKKLPLYLQSCLHYFKDNFKRSFSIQIVFLGLFSFATYAQGPGSLFVDAGPDVTIECGQDPCTDITANFLQTFETSSSTYTVSSIDYNPPFPFNGLANSLNPDIDDAWSPVDNLPFDFCYFGNVETEFQVGSNGVIRFDVDPGDTGVGSNAWSFDSNIPNNVEEALAEANVFLPGHDIDPAASSSEEIGYEVLGTYPNRVLVVAYYQVPMFSSSCNNLLATQMVVFYEFSNVIEIYMQDKPSCPGWNDGNAALGIQNNDGNIAFVPPGRNTSDSPWTATNEAWSFAPAGAPTYEFAWLDSGGNVISTNPTINVCPDSGGSTYTARATYTNCNGEVVVLTDNVFVSFSAGFSVDLGGDQELCDQSSYDITAEVIDGDPADATFLWNTGETTQTITVTGSGTYSVDVTIDTCTITESVVINFNERPAIELGDNIETCFFDPVVLDASPSNYDPADATYEWSLDGNVLAGETNPTLNATQYGVYSVIVSVADCTATDEVTISQQNIQVSLGDDFTSCFETSVTLEAEAINYDPLVATYEWRLNGSILAGETNQTLNITQAGTYTVTTTFGSCTTSDSVTVSIGNIEIELGDDFQTCFNEQVVLDASPSNYNPADATYEWSLNGTILTAETNPTLIITEVGTYSVIVSIGSCTATDSVTVSSREDLEVSLGDNFTTCPNETRTLSASTTEEGVTYQWFLNGNLISGETDSTLDFSIETGTLGTQTYSVVISLGGCTGTDSVDVNLYAVGNCVISEGISPNGDGYNDSLDLTFLSDRSGDLKLQIFNRLGASVYEQNNYTNEWHGQTNDGNDLPTGTYFYVIDIKSRPLGPAENGVDTDKQETGWIYLNQKAN